MTPDQVARVRTSWTLFVPVAETAAARFYERLFELDPSLAPLFRHAEPAAQRRKLVQTLAMVVAGIDDLAQIRPAAEALGRRHDTYGVRPEHYAVVGEALLWTLRRALGEAFDDETHRAWAAALAAVAAAMTGSDLGASPRASIAGPLV